MGNVVRFENVSKRFGDTLALSELSLDIPSGTILGIAGRNGAGKTTAIRILLGLAKPDSGTVTTFDGDTSKRIGYSPELPAPYDWMTAREYLELGAGLAGIRR